MTYDLTQVHKANLSILKEVDRICRKHNIKYMLDAGTLLGAVRHKGFIPWDDDADVAFTRRNFNKFLKVAKDELPEGLELLMPDKIRGGKVFYDFTPRILYLDSRTRADDPEMRYYDGKINHLWVDLFCLDKISDHPLERAWTIFQMKMIYGLAMGHRYKLDFSKYGLLNKIFVFILSMIGKLIPMKKIHKWQKIVAVKYEKTDTQKRYYSNYQPDYLYVLVKNAWTDKTVNMEFCDMDLMCPSAWHEILTMVYGDYRKLPPVEQRVPFHADMTHKDFYVNSSFK